MFGFTDFRSSEEVVVSLARLTNETPCVRLRWADSVSVTLTVDEAVDVVDGVAAALAELEASQPREIRRDERNVRADAEVREALNG